MKPGWETVLVSSSALVALALMGGVFVKTRREAMPERAVRRTKPRLLGKSNEVERNANWVKGDVRAPYRLVEFMDYQCPPCRMMNSKLGDTIDRHAGRIAWLVREFPLPMHQDARPAATLALAASNQVPYGRVHEALMNAPSLSIDGRRRVARSLGLDVRSVLENVAKAKRSIARDEASAKALGLEGTPSLILCTPAGQAWLLASPNDLEDVLDGRVRLPS